MKFVSCVTTLALLSANVAPALAKDQTARLTGTKRAPSFEKSVNAAYSSFGTMGETMRGFSTSTTDINYFNQNFKELKNEKPLKPTIENGAFVFREKGAVNKIVISAATPGNFKVNGHDWHLDPMSGAEKNLTALAALLKLPSSASLLDWIVPSAEAVTADQVGKIIGRTLTGIWAAGWATTVVAMYQAGPDPDGKGFFAFVGLAIGWAWPLGLLLAIKEGNAAEMALAFPVEASCKPQIRVKARSLRGDEQILTFDQNAKPQTLKVESKVDGKETGISGTMEHGLTSPYDKILGPFVENCAKGTAGEKKIQEMLAANKARFVEAGNAKDIADAPSEKDLENTDAN